MEDYYTYYSKDKLFKLSEGMLKKNFIFHGIKWDHTATYTKAELVNILWNSKGKDESLKIWFK